MKPLLHACRLCMQCSAAAPKPGSFLELGLISHLPFLVQRPFAFPYVDYYMLQKPARRYT